MQFSWLKTLGKRRGCPLVILKYSIENKSTQKPITLYLLLQATSNGSPRGNEAALFADFLRSRINTG
jgi:hypothetical protein